LSERVWDELFGHWEILIVKGYFFHGKKRDFYYWFGMMKVGIDTIRAGINRRVIIDPEKGIIRFLRTRK